MLNSFTLHGIPAAGRTVPRRRGPLCFYVAYLGVVNEVDPWHGELGTRLVLLPREARQVPG